MTKSLVFKASFCVIKTEKVYNEAGVENTVYVLFMQSEE